MNIADRAAEDSSMDSSVERSCASRWKKKMDASRKETHVPKVLHAWNSITAGTIAASRKRKMRVLNFFMAALQGKKR